MFTKKEEIDEVFRPVFDDLTSTIVQALSDWREHSMRAIPNISRGAISTMINDYVRKKLTDFAENHQDYTTVIEKGGFALTYKDQFAFRPKKVSSRLCSENIVTKRVQSINDQDYVLPGFENKMAFLTLGYNLTQFYELRGLFIIMENQRVATWHIRIDNTSEENKQMKLPLLEENAPSKNKQGRVRMKGVAKQNIEEVREA